MQTIRLRNLPSLKLVSDFHEVNIRTYVKKDGKSGVYFISMEGGKQLTCIISKSISKLPYRYSKTKRNTNSYYSEFKKSKDKLKIESQISK